MVRRSQRGVGRSQQLQHGEYHHGDSAGATLVPTSLYTLAAAGSGLATTVTTTSVDVTTSSPLFYISNYDAIHPLTITAIALGSLFCACGLCLGVLLLSRRLSQAERAISEAISLMPARVPGVAEAYSLCAELPESVPPTMPIPFPVELSVVTITKVVLWSSSRAPIGLLSCDMPNELDAFIGFSALRTAARASGPRAGPSPPRARSRHPSARRVVARASARGRPETLAPPVHQQLAVWRGVAEANEAAAQLHRLASEPLGAKAFRR